MKAFTYRKAPKEYPPSALYELRLKLKIEIYHQRRAPGWRPVCSICGKGITIEGGADMHEVFFTRGDMQGIKDEENHNAIFHACNVVLVHNGVCHLKAQHTPEGKHECVRQILLYEGKPKVLEYLEQMRDILRIKQAADFEKDYVEKIARLIVRGIVPEPRWDFS